MFTKIVKSCKENAVFDEENIRQACIKRNLYTRGGCADYSDMLSFAKNADVSTENILKIAMDIANHSDLDAYGATYEETVENLAYVLSNECVIRLYEIKWL